VVNTYVKSAWPMVLLFACCCCIRVGVQVTYSTEDEKERQHTLAFTLPVAKQSCYGLPQHRKSVFMVRSTNSEIASSSQAK